MGWFLPLLIGLALATISVLLLPRPKLAKPELAKDLENPTAEAGRPAKVIFGTMEVKDPNVLWYGDKRKETYKVDAS